MTWLILCLIAKSSTLVNVTFIAWWIVFAIMFWSLCTYEDEVATLFLKLASDMTMTVFGFEMKSLKILLSLFWWAVLAFIFLQFTILKRKQSENVFTKQKPRENSLLKEGRTSFK